MSEYRHYGSRRSTGRSRRRIWRAARAISTRARITATSFTDSCEWGDLKGDPAVFLERWFELRLYLSNRGSRRLVIRLPVGLFDWACIEALLRRDDGARLLVADRHQILDVDRDQVECEDWDDGAGWLPRGATCACSTCTG
jgi:hypothetical protein